MKRLFVSVPNKLLILVVGALLLLSAGISVLSLSRLNVEFKQHQAQTVRQGTAQFELHSGIVKDKFLLWLESFADVVDITSQNNFTGFSKVLSQQYDALQLHHNIENAWLISPEKRVMYSTAPLKEQIIESIEVVSNRQEPYHQLACEAMCVQLIAVPILNAKGDMAVMVVEISLVDVIYAINQASNSDIAVVSFSAGENARIHQLEVMSASNNRLVSQIFAKRVDSERVNDVKESGLQRDLKTGSYLVNLLSLYQSNQRHYFIALIDDVTSIKEEYQQTRLQFLLSALLIFLTLAILVYFVASPFTNRILMLSNALPLLARKEFEQFRQIRLKRRRMFADELDVVANAATELSFELEQLNIEVEQKTKELENIAMYDILTGLPNRNMLNYQLRKAVANIARFQRGVAVLFLDLEDFKKVNDSHGHSDGDKLLIEAANRVRLSVRNIDVACRFGGDEFVVILGHVDGIEDAIAVAEEILERFRAPIKIGSSIFYVSTSIGIEYTKEEVVKPEELVSHADIAMYEAKDNGGAQYHVYHSDMYKRVAQRVMLETEVRQALAKNQFSLSLQPQLTAKTKKLYGFEALLRWQHPERGTVSPDDFIPILENSEHMVELGYWVIRRCFEISKDIRKRGLTDVRIAINLSAGQFIDVNLPHYLKTLLHEFNLPATAFELELTEQTLVKDIDRAIDMMNTLRQLGFTFAIDDFGTGYSSLAYLKKMPVDVIKIDKSFVFGMLENHADYQIIMSTIAMVKNLGLQVIAEGVESSAQLRSLSENDCDIIQGYYFSKPVPQTELYDFIDSTIIDGYWKTKAQIAG
ncbi:putative bifunctional diguanylate cyclase/phosphodiesterase [Thalassotalea fusca]